MSAGTDRVGPVGVLLAATLWGTVGAAQELGAPAAAPATVAAVRSLAGGGLLLVLALVARSGRRAGPALRGAPVATVVVMVTMAGFQLGYLGGIRLTGVAIGTLLAIGSAPAFAGLLAIARGGRPGWRWVVATAATVAGAAILLLDRAGPSVRPAGVGLGLLAGLCYGSYTVGSKHLLDRGLPGVLVMGLSLTGAGVLLAPVLVVGELTWLASAAGLATALWISVAATVLAYAVFVRGLARVDAPTATTLTLAEPLTAAALALVLVGERFAWRSAVGALLLAAGLVAAALRPRTRLAH